ncbi:DNA glycosylase AlkZ-like family protein [Agrococcus sp. BE272]|uniref:DNA glycosylase AlkZ-like family protein n=1 Tax=Agrococcus sp. BE272 TaxID=2817727 RepID=UPI002867A73B|nr:crosslink repair DNA glycosylase YcaQ family protein [Agrococcus sp. BE272]MDR7234727.1 uncharacterized protein YcaQ [Agrococcus sp. BE272]
MAEPRTIPRAEARRIAVRGQLLDADRALVGGSDDLVDVARHLTLLQVNVTDIVMPAAEHVAWSRLGHAIDAGAVRRAAEVEQSLFEWILQPSPREPHAVALVPTADLPLHRPEMAAAAARGGEWLDQNAGFRQRLLEQLRADGPLPQREIDDTADAPYASSGWNTGRDVAMMLEHLLRAGLVAVAERAGLERVWDLAERVLPPGPSLDAAEAAAERDRRRLRSLGIARPALVGDAGVPVLVEGTRREWRLDEAATAEGFAGRVAILSPVDRLIAERRRMAELFAFDYALEQYTPAARRRWGAFALPILDRDRLVGKVDARTDRDAGALRVARIHWDAEPDRRLRRAVDAELESMAAWLGGRLVVADAG